MVMISQIVLVYSILVLRQISRAVLLGISSGNVSGLSRADNSAFLG